jgi:hypothetical protein
MKRFTIAVVSFLTVATIAVQAAEAQQRVARGARGNAAGGMTAWQAHDRTGPDGGTVRGGRRVITDGDGRGAYRSANCATGEAGRACRAGVTARNAEGDVGHRSGVRIEGANGGELARAGATVRSAEGEVAHKSGIRVEGANGKELESAGGFTRDAGGNIDQARTTEASGEKGSVTVDKAYTTETGRTRTVTCANAAGEIVACPTR